MSSFVIMSYEENDPYSVDRSGEHSWSCGKTTREGDNLLLYVTKTGLSYLWAATTDARPDKKWKYSCNVKLVKKINPPIAIPELKSVFPRATWSEPHNHFRGRKSLKLDPDIYNKITSLRNGLTKEAKTQDKEFAQAVAKSLAMSSAKRRIRLKRAPKKPAKITVTATIYQRNPDVVAEVLSRADGICESCETPAPFKRRSNKSPYLEVHHVKRLVDGGDDTVKNAEALCPNCHRKAHLG